MIDEGVMLSLVLYANVNSVSKPVSCFHQLVSALCNLSIWGSFSTLTFLLLLHIINIFTKKYISLVW